MFHRETRLLLSVAVFVTAAATASAQAVISARSGVVHFLEGTVYLNDQAIESRLGRFPMLDDGAELRTEQGRVEVLLTPGVILRLDQDSAVRMVSSSLDDTQVELIKGSVMVDSGEPEQGTSVALNYRDWQVRFPERGVYRIDSAPARVWVRDGMAKVVDSSGDPVTVRAGNDLPLAAALVTEQSIEEPLDALYNWDRGREDSISADNQIASNIQDPGSLPEATFDPGDLAAGGFTQFPMIGLAPLSSAAPYGGYGSGVYSSLYPYQPGFYSLYLPGYAYYPGLYLAVPPALLRSGIYGNRPGVSSVAVPRALIIGSSTIGSPRPGSPGVIGVPRPGVMPTPISRPAVAPVARPSAPAVHPAAAPHIGHK